MGFSNSSFFHESVSAKPIAKYTLGPFHIFQKIRGDIRSSRCTTGVVGTGGKWKKNLKSENAGTKTVGQPKKFHLIHIGCGEAVVFPKGGGQKVGSLMVAVPKGGGQMVADLRGQLVAAGSKSRGKVRPESRAELHEDQA